MLPCCFPDGSPTCRREWYRECPGNSLDGASATEHAALTNYYTIGRLRRESSVQSVNEIDVNGCGNLPPPFLVTNPRYLLVSESKPSSPARPPVVANATASGRKLPPTHQRRGARQGAVRGRGVPARHNRSPSHTVRSLRELMRQASADYIICYDCSRLRLGRKAAGKRPGGDRMERGWK